ncbi:MAG: phage terminase large subunit [Chloroflexota bacterium]|nr:MAG: phage terminase large subunit [Chloroflexota bacterium]
MDERELAAGLFRQVFGAEPPRTLPAFVLHEKQHEFVYSSAHHVAFVGGIGSGKSWAGCARALLASLGEIGGQPLGVPNLGVITAPTYPMLRDSTLRTWLELAAQYVPGFRRDMLNESKMAARLPNGSEVLFRSTERPERLRGPSLSWWYGDEAALYPALVRRIMVGRLRQFGALGYDWVTTTPKGRNWVWQTYARAAREDYRLITAASAENVFLDPAIMQMWSEEFVGDFARQELGGEFVAFEGLIYAEYEPLRHTSRARPETLKRVIAGVDWGFANPGVIVVLGQDGDGRVYVLAEAYERRRRVEEWADAAAQMREQWGISEFYCDPSEPEYIKLFVSRGLKAEGANNAVLPGIQAVKNALAVRPDGTAGLVINPDCVHLLSEFEQYQWADGRHGIKDAPVKANDHAMDALRYGVMALSGKRRAYRTSVEAGRYA